MKQSTLKALVLLAMAPPALAHGGHFHLDEETLEKIFQFMDGVYQWFISHLPLMIALLVAMLVLLAIGKVILTRSNG